MPGCDALAAGGEIDLADSRHAGPGHFPDQQRKVSDPDRTRRADAHCNSKSGRRTAAYMMGSRA